MYLLGVRLSIVGVERWTSFIFTEDSSKWWEGSPEKTVLGTL